MTLSADPCSILITVLLSMSICLPLDFDQGLVFHSEHTINLRSESEARPAFDSDPGPVLDSDFSPAFNFDSYMNHSSDLNETGG
ncbi:hypothetical protein EVAR_70038_1 [Eumeta japonica]|uniref:Uncharacterized protein n=1 Tax=Eumeta variegata TaxID=151549 RepID=A0A4C2ACI3_EUMVA|nr:hypothetical protein EVAR_70038_1 [Eumeta japonica]